MNTFALIIYYYYYCESFLYYYLFNLQTESILNAPKAAKSDHKLQCLPHSLLYIYLCYYIVDI